MPPVSPYATTSMVAGLLPNLTLGATDFSEASRPTKAEVITIISWISAQVDSRFSQAGYILPFLAIAGEDWVAWQTPYLQMITALGAAAYVGGHVLKPAPAATTGRQGSTGSIFQEQFNIELTRIFDNRVQRSGLRFRAQHYSGTAAEYVLTEPLGPTTDFLEGYLDPQRHLDMWDATEQFRGVQKAIIDAGLSWDYLYGLFGLNRGIGTLIYDRLADLGD